MHNVKLFPPCILLLFLLSLIPLDLFAAENALDKGIDEYKSENYEEAASTLSAVRSQQPNSSMAAFYLGLTYKQMKDYKQAETNLRDAVSLTPPVKEAYIELAEVLYALDNLNEAEIWIEKSEKEGIKQANAYFLKGLILLKRGKSQQAANAFSKAKQLDPSLTQPADLQIAIAQLATHRFEDAKKSLRTIQSIDPTSDLAAFASEYEKSLERTLQAYKPWQFSVGAAYQYDDNVVLMPSANISGVLISGEKDSSVVGTFSAAYSPLLNGPYFLYFKYDLYTNTYFHTNSHNLITQSISLNPGINIDNRAYSLPLSYSYIWVEQSGYLSLFTVKPTMQVVIKPGHIGSLSIGFDRRDFTENSIDKNENRDGNVFSVSAGYMHPYKEGRGIFSLLYEFSDDEAQGLNWANLGNRFSLSLLIPYIMKRTNLVISGDAFLQDYKNTHTVFKVKRKDRTYTGSAAFVVALLKELNLNVQYSHIRSDSNIAIYDYNRNIYTVGLEYRF